MFAGKAELSTFQVLHSRVGTNIRLGWKGLSRTSTLAFYENPLITAVKSFIFQAPVNIRPAVKASKRQTLQLICVSCDEKKSFLKSAKVNADTEEPILSQKDLKPQDKVLVVLNED